VVEASKLVTIKVTIILIFLFLKFRLDDNDFTASGVDKIKLAALRNGVTVYFRPLSPQTITFQATIV
jgi:hypothetical protein